MAASRSPSGFYLQSNTSSTSATSTTSTSSLPLPFPAPLPRSDFLTPHFNPQTYLSSLGHRHQTLEDLRSDLRARSLALNQELLDLVNEHYDEFAGLGGSLKGGGEAVEGLKVVVMGLRREVEGVVGAVRQREERMGLLVEERAELRRELEKGLRLVRWEGRLGALESRLMGKRVAGAVEGARGGAQAGVDVQGNGMNGESEAANELEDDDESIGIATSSSEDDDSLDDTPLTAALSRSKRRVHEYSALKKTAKRIGEVHPLIAAQQGRMTSVRITILLDLETVLKQVKDGNVGDGKALLKVLGLFRLLDAEREAVRLLGGGGTSAIS